MPPSIQLCIRGMLPVEKRETLNKGQREGKSTDAAAAAGDEVCAAACEMCVFSVEDS